MTTVVVYTLFPVCRHSMTFGVCPIVSTCIIFFLRKTEKLELWWYRRETKPTPPNPPQMSSKARRAIIGTNSAVVGTPPGERLAQ